MDQNFPAASPCVKVVIDPGYTGNYANATSLTQTFLPGSASWQVVAQFDYLDLEANYDFLTIYNGPNTSSPVIGTYTGKNTPGTVQATNASGALTFQFTSDGSITKQGWRASLYSVIKPEMRLIHPRTAQSAGVSL